MSEAEYRLAMNITVCVEILLYALCMAGFFYPFMTGRRERAQSRFKKLFAVFSIYTVMYFVNMTMDIYGWLCMVIVLVLLAAVSRFLEMDRELTLFLGVIFYCIKNLSVLIMRSVSFLVGKELECRAENAESAEIIFRNAAWSFTFEVALQISLLFILLCIAGYLLRKRSMKLHLKELCCLLLTPVTGILFVYIIFQVLLIVNDGKVLQLYEQFPVLLWIVPVAAAMFYAGILLTIVSCRKMIDLQEEREKYFVERQQIHAIQERMEEVEQFYDGIRRMKHEMNNHLTNIKGLVRNGSYEDIEKYIDQMDEGMNAFELTIKTGNAVTDVIVNDKQKAAKKQGIEFQSEFSYPKSEGYQAYDIGVIISNLLQNALEACEKMTEGKRYIYISGRQKKKFYLINVKNSFEGEVTFDTKTKLPLSTKGETSTEGGLSAREKAMALHGIGLSNVKREVDKYMGDVDIKVNKNEFSVTVLLQERSTK
ncbi:MAG: GHKL domain-containing protein [Butyrivibrio sp.]|nr:GHKL domain-containing protein [Muribaculum sp.]MCM1553250.1 GHKL domain-containing protein [Butyrivibrio sp.]